MMLSLYSAKAIALQIRFRRISHGAAARRAGAYDVRYFFNDLPLGFNVARPASPHPLRVLLLLRSAALSRCRM